MEDDGTWSRGRSGWGGEGGRGLREGETHSPRRLHHSGSPSHKHRPSRPVWDDTVNDLASMRLTPAELARKLASRQSANKVQARAQLLEQTRRPGAQGINIPPSLAARLHARQQSMDSILAQSSATLMASQRTRHTDSSPAPPALPPRTVKQRHHSDGDTIPEDRGSREDILRNLRHHQEKFGFLSNDSRATTTATALKLDSEIGRGRVPDLGRLQGHINKEELKNEIKKEQRPGKTVENTKLEKQQNAIKDAKKIMDAQQLAATRTSLDHTITMVVNTCRELWLQLEEERLTREHLQNQLQQQGNVITSLTSELLLIQDQQEAIIQEVSDARASGLLGVDVDLGGIFSSTSTGSMPRGDDLMGRLGMSRTMGVKTNPMNPTVSRHPQRSILKATRTIHTPHMRQSPPYQVLTPTGRTHHVNPHLPTTAQQAPPSPRPHQPSSRLHSQLHQSSPPPDPTLSQSSIGSKPDPRTLASYRSSISQKIRDALVNDQIDRSNTATPLSFMTSEEEPLTSEKNAKHGGDNQPIISTANKENCLMSNREELLDSTLTEQLERK